MYAKGGPQADVFPCRIKVDGEGLIPEDMNKVLEEWDEEKRGFRRPRVLYTVPTGQNPTGKSRLSCLGT